MFARLSRPVLHGFLAIMTLMAACESNPSRGSASTAAPTEATSAVLSGTARVLAEAHRAYDAGRDAQALPLYRQVAETGDVGAQIRLARIYARNRGVPVDLTESCNWWERAARQDDSIALTNYGLCFERGQGRSQDHVQAQ